MAQARGETGGKALEAVLAMDGIHGTIAQAGKAPPVDSTSQEGSTVALQAWMLVSCVH